MPGEKSLIGKVEQNLVDLARVWRKKPWLFWILVFAFVVIAGLYIFDKLWGIPALNKKIEEQRGQIQLLETQLTPFRTIALERFTGTEAQALAKLAFQLNDLESTVAAIQNYSEIATYDIQGNPPGFGAGGDIQWNSPLSDLLRDCYTNLPNGDLRIIRSPEAEKKFLEGVDKYPDFPFSYYALAVYYKEQGLAKWRDYAVKGLTILDQTTKIKDHNSQHDDVRKRLKEMLGQ
jgi:hypothetical protein